MVTACVSKDCRGLTQMNVNFMYFKMRANGHLRMEEIRCFWRCVSANGVWGTSPNRAQNPEQGTLGLCPLGARRPDYLPRQKARGSRAGGALKQKAFLWASQALTSRPQAGQRLTCCAHGPKEWVHQGSLPCLHHHRLAVIPASKPGSTGASGRQARSSPKTGRMSLQLRDA